MPAVTVRKRPTRTAKVTAKVATAGHYTAEEVAQLLRLDVDTFLGEYAALLTDARPPEKRGRGTRRLFLRGEVDLILSDGWEALVDFRVRMGRINR